MAADFSAPVIMSRLTNPFPELPLKLLALDTAADRNVLLQFLASSPQAAFPGTAFPLKYLTDRPRLHSRILMDGTMEASTNDCQLSALAY